uniref:ribosomal protein L5 n=1 Tax=Cocconeiopsis kantsiensis TaxID=3082010 RepID=UPI003001D5E4
MNYLNKFYKNTIRKDFINKFYCKNIKKIPRIEKIVLNFKFKTLNVKQIASSLLAYELIVKQRGIITRSKKSNILLKIKKGNPTGCKVTLRKKQAFLFIDYFLNEILINVKGFSNFELSKLKKSKALTYNIKNLFEFKELKQQYYFFNSLSNFKITFLSTSKTAKEFIFIINTLNFPL